MCEFSKKIIDWYTCNGRNLPWRNTKNPYFIWVSEIIMQQTQVKQGYQYYLNFISRFPTVDVLANASEDQVLSLWQGLGYYSRARNLYKAAKIIAEAGNFPNDYESIKSLPGIGDYTAAAISSFAFSLPYAVVDGNVYRVLSRYKGIDVAIDTSYGKRFFSELATSLMEKREPGKYNQAIMDFGAMICTPRNPECHLCPLVQDCVAFSKKNVQKYPIKSHKTLVRDRYMAYVLVECDDKVFIQKRIKNDIWEGLYELPLIADSKEPYLQESLLSIDWIKSCLDNEAVFGIIERGVRHQLSHQTLYIDFYRLKCKEFHIKDFTAVNKEDMTNYAFPQPISKMILKFIS